MSAPARVRSTAIEQLAGMAAMAGGRSGEEPPSVRHVAQCSPEGPARSVATGAPGGCFACSGATRQRGPRLVGGRFTCSAGRR